MILQALTEYYENLLQEGKDVAEFGFSTAKVSYGICLTSEGKIKKILPLKEEKTRKNKTIQVPRQMQVPEMATKSSGISANFLCDNSKYLLGIDQGEMTERVKKCFETSKKKHIEILSDVDSEIAKAIIAYFENWNPEEAKNDPNIEEKFDEITEGGNLVFCIQKDKLLYAQDDEKIKKAWKYQINEQEGEKGLCLVTGEHAQIARIHKRIKGVPGAQSSGAALVSFNAPAFESYEKKQSFNAPVGKYAEFAYTTALNYLLAQDDYKIRIGDSMVVFWAESAKEEYQNIFLQVCDPVDDNQKKLTDIFKAIEKKKTFLFDEEMVNPEQKFYVLGLAPNAARLSTRFFYQNSFGNILKNISLHYDRMEIIRPAWEQREFLGIWAMLNETVNKNAKDKKAMASMAAGVLQAIISNRKYPVSLYTNTLIRIRAEQGKITWGRAAIIKAYLIKNCNWQEGEKLMGLDVNNTDKAYVLGRMFAVLEAIQIDANPGINSTIRDRYFNSACATPASVFPILIKLKNSHIKKLERDRAGSKIYYERLLTEMMDKLDGEIPKRLALEDQGKFAIGYYHQMQEKYTKKEDK